MDDLHAIKVLIRNPEGKFLAGHEDGWWFTDDRARARVFDYLSDHIGEQLELLRDTGGRGWSVVPIDPKEIHEVCDQCGRYFLSFRVFFDGQHYTCAECRAAGRTGRTDQKS